MWWIIVIAVLVTIGGFFAAHFGNENNSVMVDVIGGLTAILGVIGIAGGITLSIYYHGASVQASVINREFGTNYTQDEVFYASNVIEIIQQIERNRVDANITVKTVEDK